MLGQLMKRGLRRIDTNSLPALGSAGGFGSPPVGVGVAGGCETKVVVAGGAEDVSKVEVGFSMPLGRGGARLSRLQTKAVKQTA